MKLLTKAIEKQLAKYPIYSQDGKGGKAQVICKFFNPCGSQTWYIPECDPITRRNSRGGRLGFSGAHRR